MSNTKRSYTLYETINGDRGESLSIGQGEAGEWFAASSQLAAQTFDTYEEAATAAAAIATGRANELFRDHNPEGADPDRLPDGRRRGVGVGNSWREIGAQLQRSTEPEASEIYIGYLASSERTSLRRIAGHGQSLLLDGATWTHHRDGAPSIRLFGEVEISDAVNDVYASAAAGDKLLRVQSLRGWYSLYERGHGLVIRVVCDPILRWLDPGHCPARSLHDHYDGLW